MREFDELLASGYSESAEMLFVSISIAGIPEVKRGGWQTTDRGKTLASQAGFEADMGGTLILMKSDIKESSVLLLSGKVVTRGCDGITRRIRGVEETRVSYICELQPEER